MPTTQTTGLRSFTDNAAHSLAMHYDPLTNTIERGIGYDNVPITADYLTMIGVGRIPNHEKFRGVGRRDSLSIAASGDDLWEGSATSIPFPDQTTGEQIVFVSTSANDTGAGTHAQQIDMHYLNAAGVASVETITLNGTTPVSSVATDVRFIQYLHVQRIGSFGLAAAGDITAYKVGSPTTVFSIIKTGGSMSLNSARMVPAGMTFYLNNISASATSNKPISLRLTATADNDGLVVPGIFLYNEVFELQDSCMSINITVPRAFQEFCVIKGLAYSLQAGGSAAISYGGWIE